MHTGKKTIHLPEPITHFGLHAENAQFAGRSKIIERGIRTEIAGEISYSTATFITAIPHATALVFSNNEWLLRPMLEFGLNVRPA